LENQKDTQKKALGTGISLHRSPIREPGVGLIYWGLRNTVIFWSLYLDPKDIRSLSLVAIWNFSKEPVLP
jgi:hypothetical protein